VEVAGDPQVSFTETHQVIINVGYAKAPEIARRLEENHIILNYQAAPDEESFSAAGSLRTGVQEMTRFGMEATDFEALAQLMADVILKNKNVKEDVMDFRKRFVELKYCFCGDEFEALEQKLHQLI
jgi:aminomethyltransferase